MTDKVLGQAATLSDNALGIYRFQRGMTQQTTGSGCVCQHQACAPPSGDGVRSTRLADINRMASSWSQSMHDFVRWHRTSDRHLTMDLGRVGALMVWHEP